MLGARRRHLSHQPLLVPWQHGERGKEPLVYTCASVVVWGALGSLSGYIHMCLEHVQPASGPGTAQRLTDAGSSTYQAEKLIAVSLLLSSLVSSAKGNPEPGCVCAYARACVCAPERKAENGPGRTTTQQPLHTPLVQQEAAPQDLGLDLSSAR